MIIVCSLDDLVSVCSSLKPEYLISVIDPGYEPETPQGVKNHLKLGFDDIIEISELNHIFRNNLDKISQLLPNKKHIDSIIDFVDPSTEKIINRKKCYYDVITKKTSFEKNIFFG